MMIIEFAVQASQSFRAMLKTPAHRVPPATTPSLKAPVAQELNLLELMRSAAPEDGNQCTMFSVQLSRLQSSLQRAGSPAVQIPQALQV